jgi:Fe2+ transport system protein FeoA
MTLNDVEIGGSYKIVTCELPLKTRSKLESLGLFPGESIQVIQKTGAGVIIEVMRSRLAIARDMAKELVVSKMGQEQTRCE